MGTNRRAEASRENGKKSNGPISATGKARSGKNALKSGIFSRALIIPAAGETEREFKRFRDSVWAHFEPADVIKAMLVDQVVSAAWRLQRTRRYEVAEIRKHTGFAKFRKHFDDIAAADVLKAKFSRYHNGRADCTPGGIPEDHLKTLDETRRELQKSSVGLEFLAWLLETLIQTVGKNGYLPRPDAVLLVDVLGMGDQTLSICLWVNELLRAEMGKRQMRKAEAAAAGGTQANEDDHNNCNKMRLDMLISMISRKKRFLEHQRKIIELCERVDDEQYVASQVLLPGDSSAKIHRVEAALERRLYKALDRLSALPKSRR